MTTIAYSPHLISMMDELAMSMDMGLPDVLNYTLTAKDPTQRGLKEPTHVLNQSVNQSANPSNKQPVPETARGVRACLSGQLILPSWLVG